MASIKDEEELALEKLVFGDHEGFEANLRKIENLYEYSDEEDEFPPQESDSETDNEDLFFIDESAGVVAESDDMAVDTEIAAEEEETAWIDSDDEKNSASVTTTRAKKLRQAEDETSLSGAVYTARLRAQFEKIYPRPSWADNWSSEAKSDDEYLEEAPEDAEVGLNLSGLHALLARTTQYVQTTHKLLPPNRIDIQRLKDANVARRSRGGIQGMSFHAQQPLLVTGGFDRTLRVYHIDGKRNPFVSSVHFRDSPFRTVKFSPLGGNAVFAAGRRRYMTRWDLTSGDVEKISRMYGQDKFQRSYEYFQVSPSGQWIALLGSSGWCNLVNGVTGQYVRGFRVDGFVSDFAFSADEKFIVVANHAGDVWEFDLEAKGTRIIRRWTDPTAVTVTKIAMCGRWLALGTKSGVVNVFDRETFGSGNPAPMCVVDNLVTAITDLKFTPDGQVLCVSSKSKKDALKLVHMPSGTVFSNWPTSGTPLGRVTTTEFSPNGQMLAIGNDVGRITLWRLNHY
ncbi:putative U3 small nucleolar RNA-associated protein [Clavispora lusitaniae]|uniref:U3 small nucleolar RNA-associated protein n=1 Tax=Clavispora lusitaniae TaxID=36911 RepID=A0AA91Q134_CLALS|nr:putative U3 small nucleolar RNA-associated protein [Clavispora lusitaniae]